MKVVDWKDLKTGDIFRIAKPESWFTNYVWYSAKTYTQRWLQVGARSKVGFYPYSTATILDLYHAKQSYGIQKQAVEVAEKGDLTDMDIVANLA
jgi:hypothetical protein